ncbi:MAG TPA: hypothetical protein VFC53_02630 [Dehalococcoidia bacterium]|nr:hypothetical protein [Dehalococcoidia bacterium]
MTNAGFRELNEYELAILLRLLKPANLVTEDTWEQLPGCRVREIRNYSDNYGSIEFDSAHSLQVPAELVVVEATSQDRDRVPVMFVLHARGHVVTELEVVKVDGSPLIERPHPETLTVAEYHISPR